MAADGRDLRIVRTGSRGMVWLEPLVEVETAAGRIGYGPVAPADVPGLLQAGMLAGAPHPLRIGRVEDHPFLRAQTRLTFARCGIVDPRSPSPTIAPMAACAAWRGRWRSVRRRRSRK